MRRSTQTMPTREHMLRALQANTATISPIQAKVERVLEVRNRGLERRPSRPHIRKALIDLANGAEYPSVGNKVRALDNKIARNANNDTKRRALQSRPYSSRVHPVTQLSKLKQRLNALKDIDCMVCLDPCDASCIASHPNRHGALGARHLVHAKCAKELCRRSRPGCPACRNHLFDEDTRARIGSIRRIY